MRRTGWLLLVGSLALAVAVGWVFQKQKAEQAKSAPQRPNALPPGLQSVAGEGWVWTKTEGDRTIAELRAKQFAQRNDPPQVDLEGVEVKVFHKDDSGYDLIQSSKAHLKADAGIIVAEGEVDMTMGLQDDPEKRNRLVTIKTSGLTYNVQTGKATTDQTAKFLFENSSGSSRGATYDPATRELEMLADVVLDWSKNSRKMHVESGHLTYKEIESKIYLSPWSKLTRDTLTLNAAASVVTLNEGEITLVEADKANGEDKQPKRNLEYAADRLILRFADKNTINRIEGEGAAKLITRSDSGITTVNSRRVDLDFATNGNDSILKTALATGDTVVESKPPQNAARVLRSEKVELAMRDGGREIERVVTHTPGEIEFLPRTPADRYRKLNGERLFIDYGANNQIREFRSQKVTTVTKANKPKQPDSITSSEQFLALFDPQTGDLTAIEQWDKFQYQEGERRASSQHARMEQNTGRMVIKGAARVWDNTGSTEGDIIEMESKTGVMIATGKVVSTRLPEKKPNAPKNGSLLDAGETTQARADKMTTRDDNQWIRYEGKAMLWQGADRIEANDITIDRKLQTLTAVGNVTSQTHERPKANAKVKAAPLFTIVKAPKMDYNDAEKIAIYTGGATLNRGDLRVKSNIIRAWFSKDDPATPDTDEGNSLERAHAVGKVDIFQSAQGRTRQGNSEYAEYLISDAKVILTGGQPVFTDSRDGTTRGDKITWYSEQDRLIVDGAANTPTESRIKRKKTK